MGKYYGYELLPSEFKGIKLRETWRELNPLKFIEYIKTVHEDTCYYIITDGAEEESCTCKPAFVPMIIGRINVFCEKELEHRYWTTAITLEQSEFYEEVKRLGIDKNEKLLWQMEDLWPDFLKNDISIGLESLYYIIKYYEATGKAIDFMDSNKETDDIVYDRL